MALPTLMDDADPWLGLDKVEHLCACGIISCFATYIASLHFKTAAWRLIIGCIIGLYCGALKEAWDELSGRASLRDGAADALGVALFALIYVLWTFGQKWHREKYLSVADSDIV